LRLGGFDMNRQSTVVSIPVSSINIQKTKEHIATFIVTHDFDPYSEYVLKQTITMLEHFEELLFNDDLEA
jgi:hypothetical protein